MSGPNSGTGTNSLAFLRYQGTLVMLWRSTFSCSLSMPKISASGVGGQPGT